MVSLSLRRLAGLRTKGNKRRGGRAREEHEAPARSTLRYRPSAAALAGDVDVEAARPASRRFAREAEHRMWFSNRNAAVDPQDEKMDAFMEGKNSIKTFKNFYEDKMMQIQDKEGGEEHIPISGNLYMYKTLAPFCDATGFFAKKSTLFVDVGLWLIVILQILAPLGMLIPALANIEFGHKVNGTTHYFGWHESTKYQWGSDDYGVSHFFKRWLGLVFLILFLMNGLYVLENDRLETAKVAELSLLLKSVGNEVRVKGWTPDMDESQAHPPPPRTRWLWLGAIINATCLMLCSLAMVFVFIVEEGPKDLVLDAFGLAFLYNLDDIGGDLAFMDEKWDEDVMGDLYGSLFDFAQEQKELAPEASPTERTGDPDESATLIETAASSKVEAPQNLEEAKQKREEEFTPDAIFWFTKGVVALSCVVLPFIYLFVEMRPKGG